jgi:hypothetical protein
MEEFFKFISSPNGRGLRIVAGLALIGISALGKNKPHWPLIIAGIVPLSAGLFDKCVLGPFVGKPFSGEAPRQELIK